MYFATAGSHAYCPKSTSASAVANGLATSRSVSQVASGRNMRLTSLSRLPRQRTAVTKYKASDQLPRVCVIGNTYMIRHTDVGKVPITKSEQVDYFFQRDVRHRAPVLKGTGRMVRTPAWSAGDHVANLSFNMNMRMLE